MNQTHEEYLESLEEKRTEIRIHKAKHEKDFLQMNNAAIQDEDLSWAAKGLLAYLLSLPPTWDIHLRYLFDQSRSGRTATESAMKELVNAGYVVKEQGGTKRSDTRYTVYEKPKRTQY